MCAHRASTEEVRNKTFSFLPQVPCMSLSSQSSQFREGNDQTISNSYYPFLIVLLVCLYHPVFSTCNSLQQVKRMSKGVCNPFYWTASSLGRELVFHSSWFTTHTWVLGIWKWKIELRPTESREGEKSGHPPGLLLGEAEVYVFLE